MPIARAWDRGVRDVIKRRGNVDKGVDGWHGMIGTRHRGRFGGTTHVTSE